MTLPELYLLKLYFYFCISFKFGSFRKSTNQDLEFIVRNSQAKSSKNLAFRTGADIY